MTYSIVANSFDAALALLHWRMWQEQDGSQTSVTVKLISVGMEMSGVKESFTYQFEVEAK